MVSGSSFAVDKQNQQDNVLALLNLLIQNAQPSPQGGVTSPMIEILRAEGTNIKFTKLLTQLVSENVNNWDEIIESQDAEKSPAEEDDLAMQEHQQQFMDLVAQMDNGVNQIPPQPTPQGGIDVGNQTGLPQY